MAPSTSDAPAMTYFGKITSIPNRDWMSEYEEEDLLRSTSLEKEVKYRPRRVVFRGRDLVNIYHQTAPGVSGEK